MVGLTCKKTGIVIWLVPILFCLLFPPWVYAKHTQAHSILEKETEHIDVKEDGTYVDTDEIFIRVLDEKGKRQHQVLSLFQNLNYSTLEIDKVELIHQDATITKIDWKKNSRETNPAQTTRMNIYDPKQKILKVFLPGLKIGDTIHYKVRIRNFKPMIKGHFFGNAVLQHPFPVKNVNLSISLPANKPLFTLIKDRAHGSRIRFTKVESSGTVTYRWNFQDIKELVPEPGMPEISRVAMRLLFSTMRSWKDVSKWYYRLSEPKLKPTHSIIQKVTELTKNKQSDMDKIKALFFFVSRKIRYMGLIEEAKRPGFEPHEVGLTFERRYGVCRDKAALLVAMLRVAGFRAAPVLVKAGGKLDKEIPVPYFNHAVAAILGKNRKPFLFLDPTSETSNQFLPDYEQDSSCLPAIKEGSDLLLTPINPPWKNFLTMEIHDKIDRNGNLAGTIKVQTGNFIDTAFRSILMPRSEDQQKKFLEAFIMKRRPGIRISELSWTDPSKTQMPFSFKCSFTIKNAAAQDRIYPISLSQELGLLDNWILSKASMTSRRYPLRLDYAIKTVIRETLEIMDDSIQVVLPDTRDISSGQMLFSTTFSMAGNRLDIERAFINKALEIAPERYQDILNIQAELIKDSYMPLLLKKEKK